MIAFNLAAAAAAAVYSSRPSGLRAS